MWGPYSVDPALGYVYLPIEAPTNDVYGGDRPGANLFSDSLMCVDIETGKVVWYRQLIHHDIWDYDMPAAPDPRGYQRQRPADQGGRSAHETGVCLRVRSRHRRSRSGRSRNGRFRRRMFRESWRSRRSRFRPGLRRSIVQGITTNDLIDFTPELRAKAIEAIKPFRIGPLYTPGSLGQAPGGTRGTIILPGFGGGANWESGAADPETGFVYVGSNTGPSVIALTRPQPNTQTVELCERRRSRSAQDRRPAADEAAVRPHHRLRHEQRRDRLADRRMATRRPPSGTIPPSRA